MNKMIFLFIILSFLFNLNANCYEYSIEEYKPHMKLNLFSPWFKYEDSNTKIGFLTEYSDILEYKNFTFINLYNIHTKRINLEYKFNTNKKDFLANTTLYSRDNREKYLGNYYYFKNRGINFNKKYSLSENLFFSGVLFYKDTKSIKGFYNGELFGIENNLIYLDYLYTEDSMFFKKRFKLYSVEYKYFDKPSFYEASFMIKNNIFENNRTILTLGLSGKEIRGLDNYYLNLLIKENEYKTTVRGLSREIYSDKNRKISADLYLYLFKDYNFKLWHCYGLKVFADIFFDRAQYSIKNDSKYFDTHGISFNFNSFFLGKIPINLKLTVFKDENNKTEHYSSLDLFLKNF